MDYPYHPELTRLVTDGAQFPVLETLTEKRQAWHDFCLARNRPCPPTMLVDDYQLPLQPAPVSIRVYRPLPSRQLPAVIYFHGGGWVVGNLDTNDSIAWGLAEGTGATVVSVTYRLAPENPYPAAFEDCLGAVRAIAADPSRFNIWPERLAVCGDSAGGNLAAAICLAIRDQGGPPLAAQALIYPVLGTDVNLPSYLENAEAPGLTREDMIFYLDSYLGPEWEGADAYAMPLRAHDLSDLPPALVHTAEFDPLRDEGRQYAERLHSAGVPVLYRAGAKMIHSFMRARFDGPALAAEFRVIIDFLAGYLFDD